MNGGRSMVKMIFVVMVAVLVVIPMFVGCTPNTQAPPPITVDNQTVKPQAPAVVDSKTVQPKPEDATASKVKGFVYESFEGGTQIYYMKESSQDRVKLGQPGDSQPSWSPDGNKIAFMSPGGLICTMDIDGSNIQKYTVDNRTVSGKNPAWSPDNNKIESDMVWSPDGKKLVFVDCRETNISISVGDIFARNADGSGLKNITKTAWDSEIGPCWSPDGQYIAFLSNRNISEDEGGSINSDCWNLYVTKYDGSEVRRVNADFPGWTGYAGISKNYLITDIVWDRMNEMYGPYLTWSPDGKYITVCTVRAQGPALPGLPGSYLYTMSKPVEQFSVGSLIIFDAKTGKEITAVKAAKRSVCWSPDSKRICYIPPAGSDANTYLVAYRQITARNFVIMDLDGSNPQTIFDCNPEGYLNWHP